MDGLLETTKGKEDIPGAVPVEAPEPLLANWGAAQEMGYTADQVVRVTIVIRIRCFSV